MLNNQQHTSLQSVSELLTLRGLSVTVTKIILEEVGQG